MKGLKGISIILVSTNLNLLLFVRSPVPASFYTLTHTPSHTHPHTPHQTPTHTPPLHHLHTLHPTATRSTQSRICKKNTQTETETKTNKQNKTRKTRIRHKTCNRKTGMEFIDTNEKEYLEYGQCPCAFHHSKDTLVHLCFFAIEQAPSLLVVMETKCKENIKTLITTKHVRI